MTENHGAELNVFDYDRIFHLDPVSESSTTHFNETATAIGEMQSIASTAFQENETVAIDEHSSTTPNSNKEAVLIDKKQSLTDSPSSLKENVCSCSFFKIVGESCNTH